MIKQEQKLPKLSPTHSEGKEVSKVNLINPVFSNPICKETYNSLPRIYGSKKKKLSLFQSKAKESDCSEQLKKGKNKNYFSSQGSKNHSKNAISDNENDKSFMTNQPKIKSRSYAKRSQCNFSQNEKFQNKTNRKQSLTGMRKIVLPEVRRFDLSDLQSEHKVNSQDLIADKCFGMNGLQKIITQNAKLNCKDDSPKIIKPINQATRLEHQNKKKIIPLIKTKHRIKPLFNAAKFEASQQSEEQRKIKRSRQKDETEEQKRMRKQSGRFKTDADHSQSPRSSNSISLGSMVFQSHDKNTKFHYFNLNERKGSKASTRKNSLLSNGLFRIPQEEQYTDYLKNYKNLSPEFSIKTLMKSKLFTIVKNQKQVYFGDYDQVEGKNGIGVNVNERQIFQGSFYKNIKVNGYERNIDGLFIGNFKNGLRSGFGVFRWNNGEVFEGNWENGMKSGQGVWRSPKGDSYEGQWLLNRQHGEGVFKHKASTYKGKFKNFLKDGKGCQIFSNGDKYEGQYLDGKPHGKGKYSWNDGGWYEGDFSKGMREGTGKWVNQNGTIYEGSFKQDFKHGIGKQVYSSGEYFQGQFWEGTRRKGKLYDKNNNCIEVETE